MELSLSHNMLKGAISNLKESWTQIKKVDSCSIIAIRIQGGSMSKQMSYKVWQGVLQLTK